MPRRYRVTIPLELSFDGRPTTSLLAEVVTHLSASLTDGFGPPLASEGPVRFDGYEGPFVTRVALGQP
jgi:hypothetical protein